MTTSGLTIGKRLALGFGSVFVLMAVLAGMAIYRVGQIDSLLIHMNDVNSVKQRYAINFRGSVHDRAIAVRDVALAATPETAMRHIEQIRKLDADYQASAGPLDQLFAGSKDILPEEKQALAAIKEVEARTQPLIVKLIALRQADNGFDAAVLLDKEAGPAFVAWLASVNRLIDLEEKLNNDAADQARKMSGSFFAWMLVLLAIAVAIGSAAAMFIGNRLLRKLGGQPDYASEIAAQIAAGNLSVPIETRADDRSSLLYAMKGMRDSLVTIVSQVHEGTLLIARSSA